MESETSVTGGVLTGARSIEVPRSRRPELKGELVVRAPARTT
jgi:hypothetical protein